MCGTSGLVRGAWRLVGAWCMWCVAGGARCLVRMYEGAVNEKLNGKRGGKSENVERENLPS